MKRILVVSEALGEPNHKRGIFHFTRELMRSLAADGHELTLLVEATGRYRRLRSGQRRARLFPADSRLVELLALYRFLDETDMSEPVMRGGLRRTLGWIRNRLRVSVSREFYACFLRAIGLRRTASRIIENDAEALEYIPPDLRHLALFRRFMIEPGFYSYQDASALACLPPPRIDARGYDLVLVDTPTRVAIRRSPQAKVVCVVHDLLPLTDLKLSDVATRLFLSRLSTSLRQADEIAFVSNYTMRRFRELLPQFAQLPARIVYPRTRFDVTLPGQAGAGRPSFVVIVSSEPRKNVKTVIRAFAKVPQADLVVIGHAGRKLVPRDLPPNVRLAGYVEEDDKAALIAAAHGLIMPSFAEGFGVPIIEALAANTPVLCSDIPVFREVAGDLADYFDPFSTESICASVGRVIAQQDEKRHHIRARRDDLCQRFGHQGQGRALLDPPTTAAPMTARPQNMVEADRLAMQET